MIKSGAVLFRLLRRTYRMSYTDPWHVLDFRDPWPMIVVMWPNHPSQAPFGGGPDKPHWRAAKRTLGRLLDRADVQGWLAG